MKIYNNNYYLPQTPLKFDELTKNEISLIINYRNNPLAVSPDRLIAHFELDLDELRDIDTNRRPGKVTITVYEEQND